MPAPQFTEVLNQQHAFLWIAVCLFAVAGLVVYIYVRGSRAAAEDASATLPAGVRLVGVENTDAMFPSHASSFTPPKAPPPLPPRAKHLKLPLPKTYAWLASPSALHEAMAGPALPYVAVRPRAAASVIDHLDDVDARAKGVLPVQRPGERRVVLPSLLLRGGPGESTAFSVEWDLGHRGGGRSSGDGIYYGFPVFFIEFVPTLFTHCILIYLMELILHFVSCAAFPQSNWQVRR